jgi:CheY-like chemotaxis protein
MSTANSSGYKHKVLIVDDETLNIEFLQTLLSEEINVIFATSGEDALTIVQANHPDMILLDIMMPGMDGYEVCKRLKANPETKDIPVIFVTAKDGPEEEARGLELGAIDYITKPFNPEIVKSKVRNNIIRIATPRPDLEKHHNKDRRSQGDKRRDRRASNGGAMWKWLAATAVVVALALAVLVMVPRDQLNADGLLALIGLSPVSEKAETASSGTGTTTPTEPTTSPVRTTTGQTAGATAPANTRTHSTASGIDRSSPLDMQWVQDSKCSLVPEVSWWKFVSHSSIVRYVERNLEGDWETYAEKWQGRLESIQDIYERNSTAITSTGEELSGDVLADYIDQMQIRVNAIICLKAEAETQAQK